MTVIFDPIHITLPDWLETTCSDYTAATEPTAQMRFVIELSRRNIEHKTGGPFAAAVFDADTGELISVGVNRVEPLNGSILHAEMIALLFAQNAIGSFSISAAGINAVLVSSCEPCAMCLGAIPWAGLAALVCGARDEDARKAGFDEGDKPQNWQQKLNARGIEVTTDILRKEAASVLADYAAAGGGIYNG